MNRIDHDNTVETVAAYDCNSPTIDNELAKPRDQRQLAIVAAATGVALWVWAKLRA